MEENIENGNVVEDNAENIEKNRTENVEDVHYTSQMSLEMCPLGNPMITKLSYPLHRLKMGNIESMNVVDDNAENIEENKIENVEDLHCTSPMLTKMSPLVNPLMRKLCQYLHRRDENPLALMRINPTSFLSRNLMLWFKEFMLLLSLILVLLWKKI